MKKIILMMVLMSLCMAFSVLGADTVTINTPSQGGTITATSKLNASVSGWDEEDSINCTMWASSPSTANSSTSTVFLLAKNETGQSESVNVTFSVDIILEDSDDYTFTLTCYNGSTTAITATSRTSVIVSRSTPTTPTTSHTSLTKFDDSNSKTITYSVTGVNTTGCTIFFGMNGVTPRFSGSNTYSMTHSGDTCTYDVSKNAPADAVYQVYVQASDGVDTATSSKIDFEVDAIPDSGMSIDYQAEVAQKVASNKTTENTVMVFIFLILLFFGYRIMKKKKN